MIDWISAFLIGRKQRVVIGECISSWSDVDSGVPKGSVLGHLLFILYRNDFPDNLTHKLKLYAAWKLYNSELIEMMTICNI